MSQTLSMAACLLVTVGVLLLLPCEAAGRSFVLQDDSFVKDGQVVQVRSAEIHYSRVPRAYWKDRLQRLQAMGMNAIATYVPWNYHEETEGNFDFQGERDLLCFLKTAQSLGLMVLLRAGPYMCGEWEFGGLPAWILNKSVTIRTFEPNYIALVDKYWGKLLGLVKPLLYSQGGPIVMMQVENEFGSYGDVLRNAGDRKYIEHLVALAHQHFGEGSVVLYTTDGGSAGYMERGSLPGGSVLTLGDGGWACQDSAKFNPKGLNACMNSETYAGWLTHWGESMANTTASDFGTGAHVARGDSFNLYMGHGGSSFGFWAGANGGGSSFQPDITSYDYDSPVSENGDHGFGPGGDKFLAMLEAMRPFAPTGGFPPEPAPLPRRAYGKIRLSRHAALLDNLATLAPGGPKAVQFPVSMEVLGQNYGLIYYEANASQHGNVLSIEGYPRDRAQVFVDGSYRGAIYRPEAAPLELLPAANAGSSLGLLVENMGRLNFGTEMTDPKGINTRVMLDTADAAVSWRAHSIALDYDGVHKVAWSEVVNCSALSGPVFYKGTLEIEGAPQDTWLRTDSWTKGVMWVNSFNLGRYWTTRGPQQAFYMPAPYLQTGSNEVILLELDRGREDCSVKFDDKPDFSGFEPRPVGPCNNVPQAGSVLHMRPCDTSLDAYMAWEKQDVGGKHTLSLSGLCLGRGPAQDAQSGQPSATLVNCSAAVQFEEMGGQLVSDSKCLDVTANGATPGERVEWYYCDSKSGGSRNELWDFKETPAHKFQVTSRMDGKCLSACPATASSSTSSVLWV